MATVLGHRVGRRRIVELDDERLATLVRSGDEAAFEVLYDRHHASLLAFCRHMLGSREDGEDALQQAFVRAHRALREGRPPDALRPWLFAIARNRCRTMLAARRDAAVPVDEHEVGFDGLAEDVRRRAELRELVADLGRLPDDQREALVLFELGDLSHAEIATTIGCPPGKVKALVFQARTALIAERDARGTPCEEIRDQLEVARGGVLRRGSLRRHLRQCEPCRAYGGAVTTQRANLAWVLPVVPTAGLKAGVLAGAGVTGGAGTAAAGAAVVEAVSLGTAATGAGAGAMATTGGIAIKGLVAKAAITIAVGAGVSGAVTAVDDGSARDPATTLAAQASSSVERRPAAPGKEQAPGSSGAVGARIVTGAGAVGRPARAASIQRRRSIRRTRRLAARLARRAHFAPRRAARRLRRLRNATQGALSNTTLERRATRVQRVRRRAARDEPGAAHDPDRPRRRRQRPAPTTTPPDATAAPTPAPEATGNRRRRRRQGPPPPTTTPTTPAATAAPTSEPDATADRPRRRRQVPPPTPPATPEPTPTPAPAAAATPEPPPAVTDGPAP
jgi:RNA polymerase sigma factor (sigma-70 family)